MLAEGGSQRTTKIGNGCGRCLGRFSQHSDDRWGKGLSGCCGLNTPPNPVNVADPTIARDARNVNYGVFQTLTLHPIFNRTSFIERFISVTLHKALRSCQ